MNYYVNLYNFTILLILNYNYYSYYKHFKNSFLVVQNRLVKTNKKYYMYNNK